MTPGNDNRLDHHFFHIARFVLEADSVFSIGSGLSDGTFDNLVVRDANGLPAIPGTTLAGVMRHLYQEHHDSGGQSIGGLFGHAEKKSCAMSRVAFSWGAIHDRNDRPVEGKKLRKEIKQDPILETLVQDHSMFRDRVKINHRGVAEDQKKFDVTVIPKSCRFSCEMTLWAENKDPREWKNLLALLQSPMLRFGGSVRSGLGRFKCVRIRQAAFDLKDSDSYKKFCGVQPGLAQYQNLEDPSLIKSSKRELGVTVNLEADDFWRFGQGDTPLESSSKSPDALPLVEPFISWHNGGASIETRHVVAPGSGVKGALRHRFAYHYGRPVLGCRNRDKLVEEAVEELFGSPHDTSEDGHTKGRAGKLWVDDCYIDIDHKIKAVHMDHTSIDRFTGGVRTGMLFTEELLWKQPLKIEICFDRRCLDMPDSIKQALRWTLADLTEGRLPLGAASAKGHGYFSGKTEWSDDGEWISGHREEAA